MTARFKVPLYVDDYRRLGSDIFLNDALIDFYLLYLKNELLTEEDEARTHIFNTYFYKRLTENENAGGYESVKSWTKDLQIFEKDFIIVPINER